MRLNRGLQVNFSRHVVSQIVFNPPGFAKIALARSMSFEFLRASYLRINACRKRYYYSHVSGKSSHQKMLLPFSQILRSALCLHLQLSGPTSNTDASTAMAKHDSELRKRQNRWHCRSDQPIDAVGDCRSGVNPQSMYIQITTQLQSFAKSYNPF